MFDPFIRDKNPGICLEENFLKDKNNKALFPLLNIFQTFVATKLSIS